MHSLSQLDIIRKCPSPVKGSIAPYTYRYSRIWWHGTLGRCPLIDQQYLGLLIRPKPASSWNIKRTLSLPNSCIMVPWFHSLWSLNIRHESLWEKAFWYAAAISLIVVLCYGTDSIAYISCYQFTGCRSMISDLYRNFLQASSFCAQEKNVKPALFVLVSVPLSCCLYFLQLTSRYLIWFCHLSLPITLYHSLILLGNLTRKWYK